MILKNQILGTFFYMLYLIAMVQPMMPLIEYNLNKEYIASALCENRDRPELACNGKCYLESKMEESHNSESHDHSVPQIDMSKYPVSLAVQDIETTSEKEEIYTKAQFYEPVKKTYSYNSSVFKPPTYSV